MNKGRNQGDFYLEIEAIFKFTHMEFVWKIQSLWMSLLLAATPLPFRGTLDGGFIQYMIVSQESACVFLI